MSQETSSEATPHLFDFDSRTVGETVPMSAVLPPGFDSSQSLPLLINLHGGGCDRTTLTIDHLPLYDRMFREGTLPPMVVVSFSAGPGSYYSGKWEDFIVDELPQWAAEQFNSRTDRDGVVMTGISMGGYGTLKVAFKNPDRFTAIAAMEPSIEPTLTRGPNHKRNSWYRMPVLEEMNWGPPFDAARWLADNPANLARDNAEAIKASGLEILLEVGDQDYINLHDGTEFLHRVLWDHDIRHDYHLVRWADHLGANMIDRIIAAHRFLAAALAGGLEEPIDLELTEGEAAFVRVWTTGGSEDDLPEDFERLDGFSERAASVHAAMWKPLRDTAADDPEMKRAYAKLPPTS